MRARNGFATLLEDAGIAVSQMVMAMNLRPDEEDSALLKALAKADQRLRSRPDRRRSIRPEVAQEGYQQGPSVTRGHGTGDQKMA